MTHAVTSKKQRLPRPPVPETLSFRTLSYMPLFVERLKKSKAWAMARSEAFLGFYLINLWTAAFYEIPATSLPNDDDLLAQFAGCDLKTWGKVRDKALHKFRLHSDGRLYHPELVEHAKKVLESREKDRLKHQRYRGGGRQQNEGLSDASHGTDGGTDAGPQGGQGGDRPLNTINSINNRTKTVETPRASSSNKNRNSKRNGEEARGSGPKFLRHIGEHRTMAAALAGTGAAAMPAQVPNTALRPALKNQARADQDMVQALMDTGKAQSIEAAWQIVMSARDARAPDHLHCLEDCTELSKRLKIGWFGDELARVRA